MGAKKKSPKKSNTRPEQKNAKGNKADMAVTGKKTLINILDTHFDKRSTLYFIICLLLNIIIGIYLFDVKVSTGGDDSGYIVSAKKFLDGESFPGWHGPFYPIFLSLLIALGGIKVILFKFFSLLFVTGHFIFFYYAFRKRLSSTILVLTSFIISVNSQILYFASQTYSEALYLLLQSVFIFLFLKLNDVNINTAKDQMRNWRYWLGLGCLIFLMSITRNIGIVVIGAVILFFLIEGKYWAVLATVLSYMIFRLPFNLYKRIVWDLKGAEFSGQLNEILLKDPYNSSLGTENFGGMITRFWDNAQIYLSKHFLVILGLKPESNVNTGALSTVIIIALLLLAFLLAFRRNRSIFFITIYLGVSIGGTFIALQKNWGQMRMIVIYAPLMILAISWALTQIPRVKKYGMLQLIFLFFLCIIFLKVFSQTADKIKVNQKVLSRNLKGNLYYGFTPDWQNFLKMSEWVGKNLPDSAVVVSRKPSMSFIYSKGKDFYPMYRFPAEDADSLVAMLKARTGPLIALKQNELYEKNIPFARQLITKPSMVAVVSQGNDVFTLHTAGDTIQSQLISFIHQNRLSYMDADSLLRMMRSKNKYYYGISPDTLLNTLMENKVEYAIAANLRANPNFKSERIINTVQRYLYIIEMKYPGIFSLRHQIGDNNNEPALLYQINYAMYGLNIQKP
ncbi:MAG: hypothetical protein JXR41_14330 [Bacteroidales bacterium]|nr:hypothetical protein [Bacteroidales bacterium]MBN2764267.1 hypothetical protein [Bacteroidales bacterium]